MDRHSEGLKDKRMDGRLEGERRSWVDASEAMAERQGANPSKCSSHRKQQKSPRLDLTSELS